ncbi:melanoma inhibitory activity 3 [Brachionus plicatilis]|uniref:Melanoma inhibitory activity 3 n=1 Tax=Brachionus plicatilis TaxID=10195 RepID=A0A3M7RLR8_BRAPC|nr:melanoma inhibitory activity 3 [Brachionus plicatilis]
METSYRTENSKVYESVPLKDLNEVEQEEKQFCLRPILGYLLGLLYAFCVCMMNIFVKMGSSLDASNHSTFAYTIQLIVMLVIVKAHHQPTLGPKSQRKLLLVRGAAGSATIILGFFSVRYLDIGDIETLSNSAVIMTAVLSRFFLNEKLTMSHILALILTITGVLFIVRPSFLFNLEEEMETLLHVNLTETNHSHSEIIDHSKRSFMETLIGVCIVLSSALCFSITQVSVRKLCLINAHFSVATLYPALIGLPASIIISAVLLATDNSNIDLEQNKDVLLLHLSYAVVGGFFGTACNIIIQYALRYEDATKIAMVKTFGVLFSFILQYLFLDITVDFLGIIGAVIIVSAILFVLGLKILDPKLSKSKNCLFHFRPEHKYFESSPELNVLRMKKVIISILVVLAIFECVFSDQINQSSSNLDSIELESVQNGKDHVFFDKTESKILYKDKNASDLDKEVDLNVQKDSREAEATSKNENPPIPNKTDNSENKNTSDVNLANKPVEEPQESLPKHNYLPESINEQQTGSSLHEKTQIQEEISTQIDDNTLGKNKELSDEGSHVKSTQSLEKISENSITSSDAIETDLNQMESRIEQKAHSQKAEGSDEKQYEENFSNRIENSQFNEENNEAKHTKKEESDSAQINAKNSSEFFEIKKNADSKLVESESVELEIPNSTIETVLQKNEENIASDLKSKNEKKSTEDTEKLDIYDSNSENKEPLIQKDQKIDDNSENLAQKQEEKKENILVQKDKEIFVSEESNEEKKSETLSQNSQENIDNIFDRLESLVQDNEKNVDNNLDRPGSLVQDNEKNVDNNLDRPGSLVQDNEKNVDNILDRPGSLVQDNEKNVDNILDRPGSLVQDNEKNVDNNLDRPESLVQENEKIMDNILDLKEKEIFVSEESNEEKKSEILSQNGEEKRDNFLEKSKTLVQTNEEKNAQETRDEFDSTLIQNEEEHDEKNSDFVIELPSTETLFTENVPESRTELETTTIFAENSDTKNNIEEPRPPLDSLSKKFGNKIKKLKEHGLRHVQEEIVLDSDRARMENSNSSSDQVCANLHNFKQILSENFEPLYLPIVSLLPEDIQLVLLNESFAGIPNASLIFLALNMLLVSSFFFLLIRIVEGKKINLNSNLNNQLIWQTNRIRQLEFDLKTYASLIEESEQKKSANEALISEKETMVKELNERLSKSIREQEFTEKELSKLKTNETKLLKESNQLRTELNSLNDVFTQQKGVYSQQIDQKDTQILEFNQLIERQKQDLLCLQEQLSDHSLVKEQNGRLSAELAECLNTVEMLKNSLSIKNSSRSSDIEDYVQVESQDEQNVDSLMNLAQLQMEFKTLQCRYDALVAESAAKDVQMDALRKDAECRQTEGAEWQAKMKKFEKQIKENEMQIRLLNELREKDTKQHVKALTELDSQLKKKTADADKVGHYMEQLRAKQERIQELEGNLARVEKQSNIERQTFEKQTHENWLNAKKLDKELRETRLELENLRSRMREIESGVNQESLAEEPPRPPSTSSNSGGMLPPNGPGFMPFMHQPTFRYPFPPINPAQAVAFMQHLEQQRLGSTSPNQETGRLPNMPPPHILQHFLQNQQFMQQQMAASTNSSQQVSPSDLNNSNILASTALNDYSMNNIDNAADNTQNMINDFDFSSNSGYFNQNGTENCNGYHPEPYSNENVNSNFSV